MDRTKNYTIATLLIVSVMISIGEIIANLNGGEISGRTYTIWSAIFIVLLAMWAQKDAYESSKHYPFEYGYFVYLIWPVLIPYHLISTRGRKGFAVLAGLFGVYWAPLIVGGITYVFFT